MSTCFSMLVFSFSLLGQSFNQNITLRPIRCTVEPLILLEKRPYASDDFPWHRTKPLKTKSGNGLNWGGYIARSNGSKKHSVSYVSGSWAVPTITAQTLRTYSFIWVGMDGYSNDTMEQIGTGHKWGNGFQENIAWFQMYPDEPYKIKDFPLTPGDQISSEVSYEGDNQFTLRLKNLTQGVVFTVPEKYSRSEHAHRSSAEWIVSLPTKHSDVLPLANFTTVSFSCCTAKMHGIKGGIGLSSRWDAIPLTMTASDGTTAKATPSALTAGGTSFTITWNSQ